VRHSRAHLTRAVLEGVAFGLKDSFELIQESGMGPVREVRVSGGGAQSPLWRQIIADVLGAELRTVNTTEGAAYGAAILAAVGAGFYESVPAACERMIAVTGRTMPLGPNVEGYRGYYEVYRELYPALASTFRRLG
jgi:xylulokinase